MASIREIHKAQEERREAQEKFYELLSKRNLTENQISYGFISHDFGHKDVNEAYEKYRDLDRAAFFLEDSPTTLADSISNVIRHAYNRASWIWYKVKPSNPQPFDFDNERYCSKNGLGDLLSARMKTNPRAKQNFNRHCK